MLDYWKSEAKSQEVKGAEENIRLRNLVNAQHMYSALARVINKHTLKGFVAFRKSARRQTEVKTQRDEEVKTQRVVGLAIELPTETETDECNAELSPTPKSGA